MVPNIMTGRLVRATIDFESRSACNLKKQGGWLYSKHPTTEAMCMSYLLPGATVPKRWHRAHPEHLIAESPPPQDLFDFIAAGGLVEAHNSFFERCIWRNIMVKKYEWPEMPHLQLRCSAAKASAASLPRALGDACIAMRLGIEKDMAGHKLMLKMCKPRKPRKAERDAWKAEHGDKPMSLLWHEEEEDLIRQWAYCDQDVLAEHALSDAVPDLSDEELALWQLDQRLNEYGVQFDVDMARAALDMATAWKAKLNKELHLMTGVTAATKRQQVKDWLAVQENIPLPDTKADTLDWFLEHEDMSGRARRVIEITKQVNRTSTRKYQSILDRIDTDNRIRDLLMFHGAGTGRWTGRGLQIHNLPRGLELKAQFPKSERDTYMDTVAEDIKSGNMEWCEAMYTDVMEMLSHAIRGTIIAPEGKDIIMADYAAIEARCLLWLADAEEALNIFRRGEDIYCDMASGIYGYKVIKDQHPKERNFGKQSILGLGFGMGFITFLITCRRYSIVFSREQVAGIMGLEELVRLESWVKRKLGMAKDLDKNEKAQAGRDRHRLIEARLNPKEVVHELALMKYTVDVYRNRYPEVKQLWKDQEEAAIVAVTGSHRVQCGKVEWFKENGFLYCQLPSSRLLSYREPVVKNKKTSWGEFKPHLSYMSVNKATQWIRTGTYGGKLVENITQATARDILANAMMLAGEDDSLYNPVMHVHDELLCEVAENEGSLEEFESLMSSIPAWAEGCPITAEAERLKRYRK